MCYKHSELACKHEPLISLKNSYADWDNSLKIALRNVQEGVAVMIYRFIKEIANAIEYPIVSPLGKCHFVIKVADELYSGTDDNLFLGIKMLDGKTYEYKCSQCGDNFERNTIGTYQIELSKDIDYKKIKTFYIKKTKHCAFDDQCKIEKLELFIQGTRVAKVTPNKWLRNLGTENIIEFK